MTTRRFPWFKLFHEARTDDKLRVLADDEHRAWFNLLCFAAEQEERGAVPPMDPFVLAVKVCNGDEALLERTIAKLARLDIVSRGDDGAIAFVHFDRRQYGKPSNHPTRVAARVKNHRANKSGRSNAPVTPPLSRDKKGELEEERETELASLVPPPEPAAPDPELSTTVDNPAEEKAPTPRWDRFVADYKAAGPSQAKKVEAVADLYRELHGAIPPPARLAALLKLAGSGEALGRAVVESATRTYTDDPLDFVDRLVRNRGSPRPSNGRAKAGMSADELAAYARRLEQEGR